MIVPRIGVRDAVGGASYKISIAVYDRPATRCRSLATTRAVEAMGRLRPGQSAGVDAALDREHRRRGQQACRQRASRGSRCPSPGPGATTGTGTAATGGMAVAPSGPATSPSPTTTTSAPTRRPALAIPAARRAPVAAKVRSSQALCQGVPLRLDGGGGRDGGLHRDVDSVLSHSGRDGQTTCGADVPSSRCPTIYTGNLGGLGLLLGGGLVSAGGSGRCSTSTTRSTSG